MDEFLAANADRSVPYRYILHGVLVHSGDVNSGHYFALLRPEKNGKWYVTMLNIIIKCIINDT